MGGFWVRLGTLLLGLSPISSRVLASSNRALRTSSSRLPSVPISFLLRSGRSPGLQGESVLSAQLEAPR